MGVRYNSHKELAIATILNSRVLIEALTVVVVNELGSVEVGSTLVVVTIKNAQHIALIIVSS